MFKHVVEINGRFYIRRWCFGWDWWDEGGRWWSLYTHYRTAFTSKEAAVNAYKNRKIKFRGFI